MVTFTLVFCNFAFLKFFVVGTENIRPTGKPQEKIIKSVEIDKRNRIIELLGKVCLCSHPLSLSLCCFFMLLLQVCSKNIISQEDASLCVYKKQVGLVSLLLAIVPFVFSWLSPLLQPTKFIEGYLQDKPIVKISFSART